MIHQFSYTNNPRYVDLFNEIYNLTCWYYRKDNWQNYSFPGSFVKDFKKYYYFKLEEAYPICYWIIFFTVIRYFLELKFLKVSALKIKG